MRLHVEYIHDLCMIITFGLYVDGGRGEEFSEILLTLFILFQHFLIRINT